MSIYSLLERLDFLRGEPAAWITVLAAVLAVVAWDMRLALPTLAVQYLVSFLLYVDVLDPRLAIIYPLTGVVVTLMMTVTAAQVNWGRPPANLTEGERAALHAGVIRRVGPFQLTARRLIRAGLALALGVGALVAGGVGFLPDIAGLPVHVQVAVAGLVGVGLAGIVTGGPLFSGLGLLIFLNGFDLFNSSVEQSIALVISLSAANFLVALVIAYLAQARHIPVDVLD